MLNALGLGWIFRAKDDTKEVIERLHGNLETLKGAGEKASMSITSVLGMSGRMIAGTAAAIGALATGAAFEFAEHSERFSNAITQAGVAAHASAEQIKELEELARNKSLDSMRGSAITVAEVLRDLAKEGMDANDAAKALDGTLSLMRISMGALGSTDAAAIVNDSLKQFGMHANQAGEFTDKLAFAMKQFGFRAEELRGTMSGLAAGAQLTGASLDDTLIAVGLVKEVFPSATKAAMSMNMAMQQLASTKAQKELRGIGVSVTDTTGKIRPLIEVIDQLASRTAHLTDAQLAHKLETIAGGRAAGGLSAVIEGLRRGVKDANGNILQGAAAVAYLREQMANTAGTAQKMSDMLGDTMGGAITALKNAVSDAGVEIGTSFEEPFKHMIQGANMVVRGLTQLFTQGGFSGEVKDALDKHLGIKGFVEGVFIWVSRLRNFFNSIGEGFSTVFAPMRPMLDALVVVFKALGQALGITGQSADENSAAWDNFGDAGNTVGQIFGFVADVVLPTVIGVLGIITGAVQALRLVFSTVGPVVMDVWQVLKGAFGLIGGLLTGNWKMMWDGFIDIVIGAMKAMIHIVTGALGLLGGLVDGVGSAFGQNFGMRDKITSAQNSVDAGMDSSAQIVKNLVAPTAPAVAAQAAQQMMSTSAAAQTSAAVMSVASGQSSEEREVHVHSHLHVDGEKLAENVAKAKRSRAARSFHAVPATEGGF